MGKPDIIADYQPSGVRTTDGRTLSLISKKAIRPKERVEQSVADLEARNLAAGKVKKVNYTVYEPFGVTDTRADHKALIAIFAKDGRIFFSVQKDKTSLEREVVLLDANAKASFGEITVEGGEAAQTLTFSSSNNPLQTYESTVTPAELELARQLLERVSKEDGPLQLGAIGETRAALTRSLGYTLEIVEEEEVPAPRRNPTMPFVVPGGASGEVKRSVQKPAAPIEAIAPVPTLHIQTVPTSMTEGMIAERTVLQPNEESAIPLKPAEPEEFALFAAPTGEAAPREFLRLVVFGGVAASSEMAGGEWQPYRIVDRNGLLKPGGYIVELHVTGSADDNVSVCSMREPMVLAHLKPGSTGLDLERLKSSKTAADLRATLQAHLDKVKAARMSPRSGRNDVLAPVVPMGLSGKNTVKPSLGGVPPVVRTATPSQTRNRIALAVGAALGFAAVATAGAVTLKSCADDAPQAEVSGMTVPDED